jgi:hypothetical protein
MDSRMPFARSSSLRGQLWDEEVQEDRELLPILYAIGQDGREKVISPREGFGLTLEVHLPIFVEIVHIDRHGGIEDRVEFVTIGSTQNSSTNLSISSGE